MKKPPYFLGVFFVVYVSGTLALAQVASPPLSVQLLSNQTIRVVWPNTAVGFDLEETGILADFTSWQPVAQLPVLQGGEFSLTLNTSGASRFFRLRFHGLTTIRESSPADDEQDVAVTRETILYFNPPLAPGTLLTGDRFYATFAGRRILARIELASDRHKATLFYLEPLPGSAHIDVTFDGNGLNDGMGFPLDADGDGVAGGARLLAFETLSLTPVASASVSGHVYATDPIAGTSPTNFVNRPLTGVTITVDGMEESLRTTTDANGFFRLAPVPPGRFFVHVDGRTAIGSQWPNGAYYPFVGKAWTSEPGKDLLAGGTGEIFLPLIMAGTLQPVSMLSNTLVTFPPQLVATNPAFAGVMLLVPPNNLFADNGTRGGKVGIAPVPPDRLPEPLPPGVQMPLVITVQTDGPQNFDQPVPACFPNLPDPATGQLLPPGAKSALVSFNHDIGKWEVVGPATVSADGQLICTDPGVGIRQPGWHGDIPGCPGYGKKTPKKKPPGKKSPPPDPPTPRKPTVEECAPDGFFSIDACIAGTAVQTGLSAGAEVGKDYLDTLYKLLKEQFGAVAKKIYKMETTQKVKDIYDQGERRRIYCALCECALGLRQGCEGLSLPPPRPPPPSPTGNAAVDEINSLAFSLRNDAETHGGLSAPVFALFALAAQQGGSLTPQQQAQLAGYEQQLDAFLGGRTSEGFYQPRIDRINVLALQLAEATGSLLEEDAFYALENLDTGFVQRGRTDAGGSFGSLILRANSTYRIVRYFPQSDIVTEVLFTSGSPGLPVNIPPGFDLGATAILADTDSDGLPDVAEFAVGTATNNVDSDLDGISDRAAVQQGLNPLGGNPAITGIIASTPTPGPAFDIATFNHLALVAELDRGVSVFNIQNGRAPTLLAQIDTPGDARAVAFSGNFAAVADDGAGLAVIDLSDPGSALLARQVNLGGAAVAAVTAGPIAFVGLRSGDVVAVDMSTGTELSRISGLAAVQDLALEGDFLYALTSARLHAIELFGSSMTLRGSADARATVGAGGRRLRLFVGDGIAYVAHTFGYNTFSLANPLQPQLITAGTTTQAGWKQIVANGSGLGVAAVGANSTDDGPHDISLYDVRNPTNANQFLTTFVTPGLARAVSLFNGLAYVADDRSGLHVINYRDYDRFGVAPTITLQTQFGSNLAEENKLTRLTARVTDDVQVRNVEFYLDGALAAVDGNFPFEYRFVTPARSRTNFTVRAKVTDTGGNATWSDLITLTLVADATPPHVLAVSPADNSSQQLGTVSTIAATFDEPVQNLSSNTFQLFSAGPDGVPGNGDDQLLSGGTLTYLSEANVALLSFPTALTAGVYRAFLRTNLTDLSGNRPQLDFVWTFAVRAPFHWISSASSFWDIGTNWSTGTPPGLNDFVLIEQPGNYTVTFRSGSASLQSLRSTAPIVLSGGTLTLNQASVISNSFTLDGGILSGSGDLTVRGTLFWTNGNMSGIGRTLAAGGMILAGAPDKVLDGRTLVNVANGTWRDSGRIIGFNGALLENSASATFTAESDSSTAYVCCLGASLTFNNFGTFRKTGGTNRTQITSTTFNQLGLVDVQSGIVKIETGTGAGEFRTSAGAAVEFAGSGYLLNGGSVFTGAGVVRQLAGSLQLNADVVVPTIEIGGDVRFANGRLLVTSNAVWTAGNLTGARSLEIQSGASLTINGASGKSLDGGTINNAGTAIWTGSGNLNAFNGGVFNNFASAVFEARDDASFTYICCLGAAGTFNNFGAFRKTGGTNATTFVTSAFHNRGSVEVLSGRLEFSSSSGTNSGSVQLAAGTSLQLLSGTYHWTPGAAFTGGGTNRLFGAEVFVDGAVPVENFVLDSGNLRGTGTLTIRSNLTWTTGNMLDPGLTEIPVNATATLSGAFGKSLAGRTFNNAGTTIWTGSGNINGFNGAIFNNLAGALFEARDDAAFSYICCLGAPGTFNNFGAFRKTGGTNATTIVSSVFHNRGSVEVLSGRLEFSSSSGTNSSSVQLAAGTALQWLSGTYRWTPGAAFTGSGTNRLFGAEVFVDGAVPVENFVLDSGNLRGTGTLTIRSNFTWTTGNMLDPGITEVPVNATATLSGVFGKSLDGRTFNNAGTTIWTGSGNINGFNGAIFNNLAGALFEARDNAAFSYICCLGALPTFNNAGVFRKTAGTNSTTFFGAIFNNSGLVDAQAGTISFDGGSVGTATGTFNALANAAVTFLGGNYLLNGASLTGAGTSRLAGAMVTVSNTVSAQNVEMTTGELRGNGTLTVAGLLSWTGGNMSGPGVTTVSPGAVLTISGNSGKTLDGRVLNNAGQATWSGTGQISAFNGANFNNLAGATFDAQSDAAFAYINFLGAIPTFNNSGTFRKTGGTGTTTFFSTVFTNNGVMELKQATVNFSGGGGFTQTPAGTLATDIGGLTAGTEFGRLTMSGVATLAGTLSVNRVNGYEPNLNDAFAILTFGSGIGQFTTHNGLAIGNGKQFQPNYSGTALILNVVAGP